MATQILSVRQDTSFDANGRPIEVMRVEYKVGDDGPFVVRVPLADFSAERVRELTEQTARELAALRR